MTLKKSFNDREYEIDRQCEAGLKQAKSNANGIFIFGVYFCTKSCLNRLATPTTDFKHKNCKFTRADFKLTKNFWEIVGMTSSKKLS